MPRQPWQLACPLEGLSFLTPAAKHHAGSSAAAAAGGAGLPRTAASAVCVMRVGPPQRVSDGAHATPQLLRSSSPVRPDGLPMAGHAAVAAESGGTLAVGWRHVMGDLRQALARRSLQQVPLPPQGQAAEPHGPAALRGEGEVRQCVDDAAGSLGVTPGPEARPRLRP